MWTKTETECLLTLYQEWPILYDKRDKNYLNRSKRVEALQTVQNGLHKIKQNVTISEIKNKIKTLRSQYIKELNKENNSKKSGAGAEDVYVPSLWCFDLLKFLAPGSHEISGESNISLNVSTSDSCPPEDESGCSTSLNSFNHKEQDEETREPKRKKRKICHLEENAIQCMNLAKDLAKNSKGASASIDTPAIRLGKMVADELGEVEEDIFFEAKWKIIEVLKESTTQNMIRKNRRSRNLSETSWTSSDLFYNPYQSLYEPNTNSRNTYSSSPCDDQIEDRSTTNTFTEHSYASPAPLDEFVFTPPTASSTERSKILATKPAIFHLKK